MHMSYIEAEKYIDSLNNRGIVPGLETMLRLCSELGNPQDRVKTVHIAGTNGKGSVGSFISSILMSGGYNVGQYISPAVEDKREIYRYNGKWIEKEDYALCIGKVRQAAEKIEKEGFFPTAFEAETAAAFVYFDMKKCGYAVIECGMGGRLDATNIISAPECSVITSVSMDHTAFLGNSIEEIAREKAGIIKSGAPVASAKQLPAVKSIIENTCTNLSSSYIFAKSPEITSCGLWGIEFVYEDVHYETSLAGLYQAENAATAIEAIRLLKEKVSNEAIYDGIKNARWSCRFEVCGEKPYWIFDGAHNADGAARLIETINRYFPNGRIVYIFGVFKDKDYEKMAELTAKTAYRIYTVTPPSERGLKSRILAEVTGKYTNEVIAAESIEEAAERCGEEVCDAVVCFGSLSFLSYIKTKRGF